ncbi:MotA/TolQ/ExbB proton channel family protein [Chitinophaga lutea]
MLLGLVTLLQDSMLLPKADTVAAGVQAIAPKQIQLWDMITRGGVLMIPLALLSVIAVFVFVERYLTISKAGRIDSNFMPMIRDHIMSGNINAARSQARNTDSPIARMIDKGIQRVGKPIDMIENAMETVGKQEVYKMEKNLVILSIIAGIAPMIGFLGTIAGMIQTFFNISQSSDITFGSIADGIYVKMVTSATGLIIGLVAYIGYSFLQAQIDKVVNKMEVSSGEFVDVLMEPTKVN